MKIDVDLIVAMVPELLHAGSITVAIWLSGAAIAIVVGFLVSVGRRFGPLMLDRALQAYVELMRGTPFLIQLFLLYYGGPFIGISLEPTTAGLVGLSAYGGAYFSEIFRAGFEAVPRGHVEAGECLGLTRQQIVMRIMLPEMAMLILPAAVNMLIIMLKETAVLSIITVPELTFKISAIGSEKYAFVESLSLLAIIYWAMVEFCGYLGRLAETKVRRYGYTNH